MKTQNTFTDSAMKWLSIIFVAALFLNWLGAILSATVPNADHLMVELLQSPWQLLEGLAELFNYYMTAFADWVKSSDGFKIIVIVLLSQVVYLLFKISCNTDAK